MMSKQDLIKKIALAIETYEGFYPPGERPKTMPLGSRSYRNNNSGNLRWIGQEGSVGKDADGFAVFPKYSLGLKALEKDIEYKIFTRKIPSLIPFFERYAPASDNNKPKDYAVFVAWKLGFPVETPFADMLITSHPVEQKVKEVRVKIVANRIPWTTLQEKVNDLVQWFFNASMQRIMLRVDVEHTDYPDVPFIPYDPPTPMNGVDPAWYDANISPRGVGYHAILLLIDCPDWHGIKARGWRCDAEPSGAVELQVGACEHEELAFNTGGSMIAVDAFVNYARHELIHALYMMQGSPYVQGNAHTLGADNTHFYYDQGKLENALSEIDTEQLDRLVKVAPEGFHAMFSKDLTYGMKANKLVAQLQKALKLEGIFPDCTPETGNYLDITARAVFEFQKKHKIASWAEMYVYPSTKYGRRVGPKTRSALNEIFG